MRFLVVILSFSFSFCLAKEIHFERNKIRVANEELQVEIADTPEKLAHGLMYRKELVDGTGMLFVFSNEEKRNFWMKNTFVALSIGFFDANKKLVDIQDMEPVQSEMEINIPTYSSSQSVKYALEVPRGWFMRRKIKLGAQLDLRQIKPKNE